MEDNEKQEVESDKKIVTGNEIIETTEEPEKEMTVSANTIICPCPWPSIIHRLKFSKNILDICVDFIKKNLKRCLRRRYDLVVRPPELHGRAVEVGPLELNGWAGLMHANGGAYGICACVKTHF